MSKQKEKFYSDSDWLADVRGALEKRKAMLEAEIAFKRDELSNAPEGALRVARHGNSFQYFLIKEKGDTKGIYIKKHNELLAKSLAQKDYDSQIIKEFELEIDAINRYLSNPINGNSKDVLEKFSPGRKALIDPILISDDEYVNNWLSVEYEKKGFAPDDPELYTLGGERVRSKSEIIIADALHAFGVPYRYEYPLKIGNIIYHPDFCCLNVRKRIVFYWEHYGMMDDIGYARGMVDKSAIYTTAGYLPGYNLIETAEISRKPVDIREVKAKIKAYLL